MISTRNSKIEWCQPSDNRRRATATLFEDGTLRFGTEMCERFRNRKIRIGLMSSECALVVEINTEGGFKISKLGETKVISMIQPLKRMGVEFPVSFLFDEEKNDSCWKGYIIPPLRKTIPKKPKKIIPTTEHQPMLNAYKWLLDRVVCNYAKSTPIDERRSMAVEAFIGALSEYAPVYGTLKEFLFEKVKLRLIEHNKQYTKINHYNTISLDAPISKNNYYDGTNYEWLWIGFRNEISAAENRIDMDIFKNKYLNFDERKTLEMLLTGYTVSEILDKYSIEQHAIDAVCKSIGEKWQTFNGSDNSAA